MMLQTLLHTIRQNKLFTRRSAGAVVVLAVSGGADSLALLHGMARLRKGLGIELHVATLDHGLRGAASADDARFVADFAAEQGVPCTVGQADVRQLAKTRKMGIEAAARTARYDFLADVARQVGAVDICTGHHADDQAETVLMHLLRGSGLKGLTGMALTGTVPGHADLRLHRPLLHVTRREIEAYCAENGLHPRHDASNDDPDWLRNHIRLDVLPTLQRINPNLPSALVQLADIARVEDDFVAGQLAQVWAEAVTETPGRVSLDADTFAGWHPALQRRAIMRACAQIAPDAQMPGYAQVVAAVALACQGETGATVDLTGRLRLRVDYEVIYIERHDAPDTDTAYDPWLVAADCDLKLPISGLVQVNETVYITARFDLSPVDDRQSVILRLPEQAAVLRVRTRRPGDRFRPAGMGGQHKKLKNWFIDGKVPRQVRDRVPLVLSGDEIVAILVRGRWVVAEPLPVESQVRIRLKWQRY